MKHYSAELLENNDVAANGNIVIGTGRTSNANTIVNGTVGANQVSSSGLDGFIIIGNNREHILDGQGGAFDPNIGTTGSNSIIDLVRDITFDSTNNFLRVAFDSDVTAGAAIAANRGFNVDLSSLAGGAGGGGATTNSTNGTLPIKYTTGVVNSFENSEISVTTTNYVTATGYTYAQVSATSISLSAGPDASGFADGAAVTVNQIDSAGAVVSLTGTVTAGTQTATGLSVTIASGADAAFDTGDTTGLFTQPTQGAVTIGDDLIITGDLQVGGTQTTVNQTQVDLNDSFITLNSVDTATASDFANMDGGLLVLTDVASNVASYAGIRYNASADSNNGAWEVANSLNANTGADGSGTWKEIVCVPTPAANTVTQQAPFKVAGTFPSSTQVAAANALGIVVANADGISTWAISTTLGTNELMVQVFDSAGRQVIPDEITVSSTTMGLVTISMPGTIAAFATTDVHRFVIIG